MELENLLLNFVVLLSTVGMMVNIKMETFQLIFRMNSSKIKENFQNLLLMRYFKTYSIAHPYEHVIF